MVGFLRDLIAIPSESCGERAVIRRIEREVRRTRAYDTVRVDGLGNLLATVGHGPRLIAIDAHVDTVGVGSRDEWKHDPYTARVEKGFVYGRGAGDQEGAIPPMVYAGRIIKDLGLRSDEWTLLLTFTVMEEDCDGLCWQHIVRNEGIRPECAVVTDSTNCHVLRGQRGRMEVRVTVAGRSCHGSMPEKGDNAVYKIARVIAEIEKLNDRLRADEFLGKGTITVSQVTSESPSLCAVPGAAAIHIDRRLTAGETRASALAEIRDAVKRADVKATVEVPVYAEKSYTGLTLKTDKYYPTWCAKENEPQVQAAVRTCRDLFGEYQTPGRWTFSTNGVAIAGMFGIPCVGYGPAEESVAHTVNDRVPIEHLVKCAAFYAAFPGAYCANKPSAGSVAKKAKAEKKR